MKKKIAALLVISLGMLSLGGCGSEASTTDVSGATATGTVEVTETSTDASTDSDSHVIGTTVITQVYGDGQKVAAVAIRYDSNIDSASVSADDYSIEHYTIESAYVSDSAAITDSNTEGSYVILNLSTDYNMSNYVEAGDTAGPDGIDTQEAMAGGPGDNQGSIPADASVSADDMQTAESSASAGGTQAIENSSSAAGGASSGGTQNGGMNGGMQMPAADPSNELEVTLAQTGDVSATDGSVLAGSDSTWTTDYEDNSNLIVDEFTQDTYTADDGSTLMYSIYVPEDYDGTQNYPVVMFMGDATTQSTDPYISLTEGLGGVVWASQESQEENPCIVLVPQYTGEDADADTANTVSLLNYIVEKYNADANRLYVTGQSAGTIRAIGLMIDHPDLFAGAYLVAGQADDAYADKLAELADQNIWMICSGGDVRSYPGMTTIEDAVESAGTDVTDSSWSAELSEDEQNEKAKEAEASGTSVNFTVLDSGSMIPDGVTDADVTEHMNTWRVAYSISEIRNWLFQQTNE